MGGAASPGIHWTPVSPCSSHCSGIQGGPEWLVTVSLEFYNPEFWWALRTTPVPLPPPHCAFLQDWHYQPLDRSHSNAERQPFQPQGCFRCSANGVYNGSGGHRHFPGTRVMCPSPISAQLGHTQCEQGRVTEVEQESQWDQLTDCMRRVLCVSCTPLPLSCLRGPPWLLSGHLSCLTQTFAVKLGSAHVKTRAL